MRGSAQSRERGVQGRSFGEATWHGCARVPPSRACWSCCGGEQEGHVTHRCHSSARLLLTADGRVHEQCGPEAGAIGRLAAVLLAEREHHQVVGVQRLEVAHCVVRGENVAKRGEGKRGMVSDGGGRFRSAAAGHGRARASERARSGPAGRTTTGCTARIRTRLTAASRQLPKVIIEY